MDRDDANAGSFFNTNVTAYLASGDPLKSRRAEAVISGSGTISLQVPNELTKFARRKMRCHGRKPDRSYRCCGIC